MPSPPVSAAVVFLTVFHGLRKLKSTEFFADTSNKGVRLVSVGSGASECAAEVCAHRVHTANARRLVTF